MKIAVMQPYFFPYIGYFQLINAVDKFVIYDDVNFIKQGWINRNYILLNNNLFLITIPIKNKSSYKKINKTKIAEIYESKKLVKTIYLAYKKAPFFEESFRIIRSILDNKEKNLSLFLINSLIKLIDYLNIKTEIIISSQLSIDEELKREKKIIAICNYLNANIYINPIGGQKLYSKEEFLENGIKLYFLRTKDIRYKQFTQEFVPNLSIIDVMMFNSKEQIREMLNQYELI